MKTKILLSIIAIVLFLSSFSQKPTMELTFTAENNGQYVALDSILIENLTQGGDTTLYVPDTVLVLDYVTSIGSNETLEENTLSVSQNYPNPFIGKTEVNLCLPEKEYIKITIRDIVGRELAKYENTLNRGNHSFAFYSGNEKYYFLTITGKQASQTIKMLNAGSHTTNVEKCKIIYNEYDGNISGFKSKKAINNFVFTLGDELRYIGYATTINQVNGIGVIEDAPITNTNYEFNILELIPCPGIPTITYEGQVYNTVLIGAQCFLKENLNVGSMIPGTQEMGDNGTIEKYCYDNDPANCDTYGGIYQWGEAMQYTEIQGAQGICPPDWHLPTDEEWKLLEGTVDSQYGYPDPEWDDTGWRGFDAGLKLKSSSGWYSSGNGTDEYSFTGLPGGLQELDNTFDYLGEVSNFWSSTAYSTTNVWVMSLHYFIDTVGRFGYYKTNGMSIRCLKD